MRKLTPKQEKFCKLYLQLGNASEAYRQAYSCVSMSSRSIENEASRLLKNPHIAPRIKELQSKSEKVFIITAERKKKWLEEVIERSMQAKPVDIELDGDGKVISMKCGFDGPTTIKAITELNKMDGDLAPTKTKSETTTRVTFNNDYTGQEPGQ